MCGGWVALAHGTAVELPPLPGLGAVQLSQLCEWNVSKVQVGVFPAADFVFVKC